MINNKVTVFGGSGFVGSHFLSLDNSYISQRRDDLVPYTNNIVWFISTVDNYNVFSSPTLDIETNMILLVEMLEHAKQKFGGDFIVNFISSWFVYGNTKGHLAYENTDCNPTGFYSITKKAAEDLLISYSNTFGNQYRILRLSNVMGRGDKKASKKKNAIQHMITELRAGNEVQLYREPSYRNIMDVRDCANAIEMVIFHGEKNSIYNIGNPTSINVNELIIDTQFKFRLDGKIKMVDVPEFHKNVQTRQFFMDTTKLKKLGYSPKYSIEQTIEDILNG